MGQAFIVKTRHVWLALLLCLSGFLDFSCLNQNGYGNTYYAAAVKSMMQSLHNFFFVSFDPAGYISIDKPPVGFWIQTASAWLLGFHGWSLLFPEALSGVVAVWLVYVIVARFHGSTAGLIAAFLLAITPISVATNRNNTIDSILVVTMLIATWAFLRATDGGKIRWLICSAAILGVGFNIKFAEAFLVLPAFIVVYLLVRGVRIWTKIVHLFYAAVVLSVVSLSWSVVVDLVPAGDRPWVGSTQVNSELNLAFGYDGVQRVAGRFSPINAGHRNQGLSRVANGTSQVLAPKDNSQTPTVSGPSPSSRATQTGISHKTGGSGTSGSGGIWTLFGGNVGEQIGWWLPAAILGVVLALWQLSLRHRNDESDESHSAVLLWASWLATTAVYFTLVPPLHTYYTVTMAPAAAAAVAIGFQTWMNAAWKPLVKWGLASVVLLGMTVYEWHLINPVEESGDVLDSVIAISALVSLFIMSLWLRQRGMRRLLATVLTTAIVISLDAAPAYFAATNDLRPGNPSNPVAGIPISSGFGRLNSSGAIEVFSTGSSRTSYSQHENSSMAVAPKLIQYLKEQYTGGYLVATLNAATAAPLIITTGLPVMAMGGFRGTDPAIDPAGLRSLAKSGKLKYFLVPNVSNEADNLGMLNGRPNFNLGLFSQGDGTQEEWLSWIKQNCKAVPTSAWASVKQTVKVGGSASDRDENGEFGINGNRTLELYVYVGGEAK